MISATAREETSPASRGHPEDGDAVADLGRLSSLVLARRGCLPVPTAVVYPLSRSVLEAVVEGAVAGIIAPILIGPEQRIRATAATAGLDVTGWSFVDASTDAGAAAAGVDLARQGVAKMLMKGNLHTGLLLHAVLSRSAGLRAAPWISHVFVLDLPTYPKLLLITDAVVAVAPTLEQKAVICRNAITVAHSLGIAVPKVAVLSATEEVDPGVPSTVAAAALAKMCDRGQITGGVVDGPLAMDSAISAGSARSKGIASPVAGDADILVVPNLEAGNIVYKALTLLAGATAAGVVVGAAVPIVLTSRTDSVRSRLASAALGATLLSPPSTG